MQPVILLMDLLCLVLGSQERYGEWRASKGGSDNCYKALSPFCVQSFFGMPDSTNASLLQTPCIPTASWWDIWVKVVGSLLVLPPVFKHRVGNMFSAIAGLEGKSFESH